MNKNLIDWDHQQKTTHRKSYNNDAIRETIYAANGIILALGRMGFNPSRKEQMRIANKLHKRVSNYLKTHPYIPDTVYPNVARTSRPADL